MQLFYYEMIQQSDKVWRYNFNPFLFDFIQVNWLIPPLFGFIWKYQLDSNKIGINLYPTLSNLTVWQSDKSIRLYPIEVTETGCIRLDSTKLTSLG